MLADLAEQFNGQAQLKFNLSSEFDWYTFEDVTFKRIFTNLISNSIKAGASQIEVIGMLRKTMLVVSISDNGKGIPVELQPYIFEKGITSDKATGYGLGLNFVSEKLKSLGFRIVLAHTDLRGTKFEINLPLNEIVLIDDNQIVKDTWTTLGSTIGIRVHCFESENPILENQKLPKNIPIFVDYNLGKVNGEDVYFRLLELGFTNVSLATGETRQVHPSIRQVGKEFPAWASVESYI